MSRDTCPKYIVETAAWIGFAKVNSSSNVTSVGPSSKRGIGSLVAVDGVALELKDAGWNLQTELSVLNSDDDVEPTACGATSCILPADMATTYLHRLEGLADDIAHIAFLHCHEAYTDLSVHQHRSIFPLGVIEDS